MRAPATAFCTAAFAASLALAAPHAAAATPEPQFPRSEPQASGEVHQAGRSEPQASGEVHQAGRSEPEASGEVSSNWVGRYCTPAGCPDAPSAATQAASFGAASATIIFLARRRRA